MRDFEVLTGTDQLRALSDPVRLEITALLRRKPHTGSMLARALGIPANRAHYHLQKLIEVGLVHEIGRGRRRWTEERYFSTIARHFLIDPGLASEGPAGEIRQQIDMAFLDWRRSQILAIDWAQLARHIVRESLVVRPTDHVLVLFPPVALELAEAIAIEIEATGAVSYVRPWSRAIILGTLDRHDGEALDALSFVPRSIDDRLSAVVLLTSTLIQGPPPNPEQRLKLPRLLEVVSRWHLSVRKRGLRFLAVSLPSREEFAHGEMTQESAIDTYWQCITADARMLHERGRVFLEAVHETPMLRIEGRNGSTFEVDVDASGAVISDGILSSEDLGAGQSSDALPAGSFSVLPLPGSGAGVFEADFAFTGGAHVDRPRVTIHDGRITAIEATSHLEVIQGQLTREGGDANRLAEITVGLNAVGTGMTGKTALDCRLAGTVTLTFANNELSDGDVKSTLTLNLPARGATVRTKKTMLVASGRLADTVR